CAAAPGSVRSPSPAVGRWAGLEGLQERSELSAPSGPAPGLVVSVRQHRLEPTSGPGPDATRRGSGTRRAPRLRRRALQSRSLTSPPASSLGIWARALLARHGGGGGAAGGGG